MTRILKLTFTTEGGSKATLAINNIKEGTIEKSEIEAVMNTIIEKDIFSSSTGGFEKAFKATITESDVIEYDMQ